MGVPPLGKKLFAVNSCWERVDHSLSFPLPPPPSLPLSFLIVSQFPFQDNLFQSMYYPLQLKFLETVHTLCGRIPQVFLKQIEKTMRRAYEKHVIIHMGPNPMSWASVWDRGRGSLRCLDICVCVCEYLMVLCDCCGSKAWLYFPKLIIPKREYAFLYFLLISPESFYF